MKPYNILMAASDIDLHNIMDVQIENHRAYLTTDAERQKGYVSLLTPFWFLQKINCTGNIIVANEPFPGDLVGYVITVDQSSVVDHPFLNAFADRGEYESIVTEIDENNVPSLRFHEKHGFKPVKKYTDAFGNAMQIVKYSYLSLK